MTNGFRHSIPRAVEPDPSSPATIPDRQFPALTEMQEAFCHQYVADPTNQERAARRAGYTGSGVHVTASRLMQKDTIIQAITKLTLMRLGAAAPKAAARLIQLVDSAKSENVRFEASRDVLDRLGLTAPKQHRVGGSLSVTFDLG